jgi:hypothetical protein
LKRRLNVRYAAPFTFLSIKPRDILLHEAAGKWLPPDIFRVAQSFSLVGLMKALRRILNAGSHAYNIGKALAEERTILAQSTYLAFIWASGRRCSTSAAAEGDDDPARALSNQSN